MNIFVLDTDIKKCVEYYNNKHVVKMILESAQILSSVNRQCGLDEGYKATHTKHPCTLWAMTSKQNWLWLRDLLFALHDEWKYRYDRDVDHKSAVVAMSLSIPPLPDIGLTSFALAMPEQYKTKDPVESYRKYYMGDKRSMAEWKKRDTPYWWE